MVSLRCKMVVKQELKALDIKHAKIELGTVELFSPISDNKLNILKNKLAFHGLELLDDNKNILIDKIKHIVIELIHYSDELPDINISDYLSEKLNLDYHYLSNCFSEVKGTDLQHYIINHKIERVKELLLYDELSLTEISYKLNYSSVSHLSNQFKKVTGLTPTFFKQIRLKRNKTLKNL